MKLGSWLKITIEKMPNYFVTFKCGRAHMAELTKKALSDALIELLQEKRLDRITIAELTERAGVNRQTFYYHFSDIFDLLKWTVGYQYHKLLEKHGFHNGIFEPGAGTVVLDTIIDKRVILLNVYRGIEEVQILRILHDLIDADMVKRINAMDPDLSEEDVTFASSFYTSGFIGIFIEWLNTGLESSSRGKVERLFPVVEHSLALLVAHLS